MHFSERLLELGRWLLHYLWFASLWTHVQKFKTPPSLAPSLVLWSSFWVLNTSFYSDFGEKPVFRIGKNILPCKHCCSDWSYYDPPFPFSNWLLLRQYEVLNGKPAKLAEMLICGERYDYECIMGTFSNFFTTLKTCLILWLIIVSPNFSGFQIGIYQIFTVFLWINAVPRHLFSVM